jgi:hypothetical protein
MDTRLAEQMALSVLRGDMSAAMALADLLMFRYQESVFYY